MFDFITRFYSDSHFAPHGECLVWNRPLLWLHVGSDLATALAYYAIGVILFSFIVRRRDLVFRWVFVLFGLFILSCGTTHLLAAWTIYFPAYWGEGVAKAVNAAVSCLTAVVMIPQLSKFLALPSLQKAMADIEELNQSLHVKITDMEGEVRRRERAEAEAKSSEAFLDSIIENIPNVIFLKDAQELRFVRLNKAGEELLGAPRQDLLGKNDYDLFPKEEADYFTAMDRKVLARGHLIDIPEETVRAKGKGQRLMHTKKLPLLDANGKPEFLLGIAEDITEQRQILTVKEKLEEQLRQAHKMEAIGTLAGGVAHDFNNILAIILGYADMARDQVGAASPVRRELEQIIKAGYRARDIVRQILAFSRKQPSERSPLTIHLIVKETIKFLRATLPSTIDIRQEIEPGGTILADATQIHQLLLNLCTNAAHAMEANGGLLTIRLESTEVAETLHKGQVVAAGTYLRLTVQDTGHGMEPEVMERIFDPYFTTKGVGRGSGMGLAVVHGIVASHGGMITVDSTPGQGSVFQVYFPKYQGEPPASEEADQPLPQGNERLLVVDDEENIAILCQRWLTQLGYRVTATSKSREALELVWAQPQAFDLVLTDQTMPQLTGDQLAKELLAIRPDLPIILCTGYSAKVETEELIASTGVRALAMKPLDKANLAMLIRQVLTGSES